MTKGELKNQAQELLDKMGFYMVQAPDVSKKDDRFFVDIFVDEPRAVIGEKGSNLRSLQHIIRLLAKKKFGPDIQIDIDINGYKRKREEFLRDLAMDVRRRVIAEKKDIAMEPMNAFDRRAVHSALSEFDDVETESTGEGFERKVVVKVKK